MARTPIGVVKVSVSISKASYAEIDKLVDVMNSQLGGARASRSSVIQWCLGRGLSELAKKYDAAPRRESSEG